MKKLSLRLLGSFSATLAEEPIETFRTNKVQAFLIYLVTEGKPVRRIGPVRMGAPGPRLVRAAPSDASGGSIWTKKKAGRVGEAWSVC